MHLTNKEILDKLLSYSEDLKHHYNLYQLLLFHLFFRLCLKPSSKIKRKSSTPFNYLIPTPNWKPPIISSNLSSTMPLVLGTLKTSKKKGRNLSFLDLRFLQPTTVDKEPFLLFKNLISSMHPRRHPLKELRGRHVVSIQFFVLE
ncbi:transposase-like protein [Streptococcus pneumoniae]|nr:transposase-like protein [Streptococcus pneumoniae]CJX51639.1 transposase-like protein [Streptococcus pneumoniae]